jgi:hypothetical protein
MKAERLAKRASTAVVMMVCRSAAHVYRFLQPTDDRVATGWWKYLTIVCMENPIGRHPGYCQHAVSIRHYHNRRSK